MVKNAYLSQSDLMIFHWVDCQFILLLCKTPFYAFTSGAPAKPLFAIITNKLISVLTLHCHFEAMILRGSLPKLNHSQCSSSIETEYLFREWKVNFSAGPSWDDHRRPKTISLLSTSTTKGSSGLAWMLELSGRSVQVLRGWTVGLKPSLLSCMRSQSEILIQRIVAAELRERENKKRWDTCVSDNSGVGLHLYHKLIRLGEGTDPRLNFCFFCELVHIRALIIRHQAIHTDICFGLNVLWVQHMFGSGHLCEGSPHRGLRGAVNLSLLRVGILLKSKVAGLMPQR